MSTLLLHQLKNLVFYKYREQKREDKTMTKLNELKQQAQCLAKQYFGTELSTKQFKALAPWTDLRAKLGWQDVNLVLESKLEEREIKAAEKFPTIPGYSLIKERVESFGMELRQNQVFDNGKYRGQLNVKPRGNTFYYGFETEAGDIFNSARGSLSDFVAKISQAA